MIKNFLILWVPFTGSFFMDLNSITYTICGLLVMAFFYGIFTFNWKAFEEMKQLITAILKSIKP